MKIASTAQLPSHYGTFKIVAFSNGGECEPGTVALVKGEVDGQEKVLTRVHSQCLTGDTLCSLRCDCHAQLIAALELVEGEGKGIVLYLPQEGRGIGLVNKIKAYSLQDSGMDTVEANRALGFKDDERDWTQAAQCLHALGVKSIVLLTNNPHKTAGLKAHGVKIVRTQALRVGRNRWNEHYLKTKKEKLGQDL